MATCNLDRVTPKKKIDGGKLHDVVGDLCEFADSKLRRPDYFVKCFETIGKFLYAVDGSLNLRTGARTLERTFDSDESKFVNLSDDLDSLVLRAQTDSEPLLQNFDDSDHTTVACIIAAPLLSASGHAFGSVGFVIAGQHCVDGTAELAILTQLLNLVVEQAPTEQKASNTAEGGENKSLKSVVRASDFKSIKHLCYAIVNSLCQKLSCEQISIGIVSKQNIRLVAVSGLSEVPGSTPGMQAVRQAMATCLDRNEASVYQEDGRMPEQCESSNCKVHQLWHRIAAGASVATIPLRIDNQCVAVIALRRSAQRPFMPDDLKRAKILSESFAPALPLVDKASRTLVRHIVDAVTNFSRNCYGRNGLGKKAIAAGVFLTVLYAFIGKTDYEVLAPCKIVANDVVVVASSMDAAIKNVLVEPGVEVAKGQLLVEFDQKDLLNDQVRIRTQIATTRIEANSLLQNGESQDAFLLQSKLKTLMAELQIVDQKLSRSKLFAERAGVILPSEIHNRIGQFVKLGEPLFEIADKNNWQLEIETPEHEVRHVQIDQQCQFQSRARPDQISHGKVSFISPSSKIVNQNNVVLTNAKMRRRPEWMKIGMEGYAKIDTGKQPVWWVYAHPLIDFVRLQLWI